MLILIGLEIPAKLQNFLKLLMHDALFVSVSESTRGKEVIQEMN